jgi:anti-sigma regulatory factor (Ser/Thr protein kinase)
MESAPPGYGPPDDRERGESSVPLKLEDHVRECELRLQVPATADHLRTVRLVAADAAERAGFDCDETDDLRIAVDELSHAVMSSGDAPIVLGFVITPGLVEVRAVAERKHSTRALEMSPVSQLVVDSVSESFELIDEPDELGFALVKRTTRATDDLA